MLAFLKPHKRHVLLLFITAAIFMAYILLNRTSSSSPEATLPPGGNSAQSTESYAEPPLVVGVTYGEGDFFESSGRQIKQKVLDSGDVDHFNNFNRSSMLAQFPEYSRLLKSRKCKRPACMIHRPLTFLWAMDKYPPGTWIFWIDSSKHYHGKVDASVRKSLEILQNMGLDALPGAPLCQRTNWQSVDMNTFKGMGLNTRDYWFAPQYQNIFFAFRNIPKNRVFMEEYLKWSLRHDIVAPSWVENQAVFSLLVTKYQIPTLHFCHKKDRYQRHEHEFKDSDIVRSEIIQAHDSGSPMKVYYHEEFMELWRDVGWSA